MTPRRILLFAFLFPLLLAAGGCLHELERLEGKPPPTPTGLSAVGSESSVVIRWDVPEVNVPHNLYFTPQGGEEEVIENITNPYVHRGLSNGVLYTYRLEACNTVGCSPPTPPVTTMPVVFNWQEAWTANVIGNNHPLCNADPGGEERCLLVTTGTNTSNSWYTSRWYGGPQATLSVDAALTYLRLYQNFDMTVGETTYTMAGEEGLNMRMEEGLPSYVELRDLNIPVTAYTEIFIRDHEAVLTEETAYAYLEITPVSFTAGDACLGRRIRYVLANGGPAALAAIPQEEGLHVVELGDTEAFFRRNLLPDLQCEPSAYAIGGLRLGIEGASTAANWVRWSGIGIIGPPLN